MFSNLMPYVCSNIEEFKDERDYLKQITFPGLKQRLDKLNINFDPVQLDWSENDEYFKSGNLLRLLLHNIQKSSPFFMGLLGFKYGPYLKKRENIASNINFLSSKASINFDIEWLEKNYIIASQTGFSHIINSTSFSNSILEHQINTALDDENSYPFYRFYYRQYEYLEDKYMQLSIEERKKKISLDEAENEFCENKIKELKMKIAKKGLIVKYYKTLEELNDLVYDDFIEMVQIFVTSSSNLIKTKSLLRQENLIYNRLNQSIFTDSIKDLLRSIDIFLKPRSTSVQKDLDSLDFSQFESYDGSLCDEKEDYLEILRLRHINLTNSISSESVPKKKKYFIIHGPRGKGKTSLMASLYQKYINTSQSLPDMLFLFYFLEPQDYLINVLFDITCKLRAKYLKKDSIKLLNEELYDQKSIVEQFHASIALGPAYIFLDGLSELENQKSINLNQWLPVRLDTECKFVLTLRKSSDYYTSFKNRPNCLFFDLSIFGADNDYRFLFSKLLGARAENDLRSNESNNALYGKFLSYFNELKTSEHVNNPLYLNLISQEIFSFDKEIYKTHPVHLSRALSRTKSIDSSLIEGHEILNTSQTSFSSISSNSVNIMNSYFEEVHTIREIIQKILKRYLRKNNWSVNTGAHLSTHNPGWVGEVLCLIALCQNGIRKDAIFRILDKKGYKTGLNVTDLHWKIFRMQFGNFIIDGLNGVVQFSHSYFNEAVQALLLDGFSVKVDEKHENVTPIKKNISEKQREYHYLIIIDLFQNEINKQDFNFSFQIDSEQSNFDLAQNYIKTFHEIFYHMYMVYDILNLKKLLSDFNILQIFIENRSKYLTEWFDLCEYIKLVFDQQDFRFEMVKNLTSDLSGCEIELKDENLGFKYVKQDSKFDFHIEKSETIETRQNISNTEESLMKNYSKFCETLISELIDSPILKDTKNMVLMNRALILIDLVKYIDDKYFIENYSFSLLQIVYNIIIQNYPLNDTEKLKYSYLLENLSKMAIQLNNIDLGLKYIIKCIEVLEDLFDTFHVCNLNKKFKTKIQLLQISNRLSSLHSNMALLLLKMNNLNGAEILLSKSKSYNSEQLTLMAKSIEKSFNFEVKVKNGENFIKEKNDAKNLIYQKTLEDYAKSNNNSILNDLLLNCDDAGSYEAKFNYLFINGLFYVQKMEFNQANKCFQFALNLSIKFYGKFHSNTAKIYHYFGCFFSLQDMEFCNVRRAELYLRKALYIKDKDRTSLILDPNTDIQKMNINSSLISSSSIHTSRSSAYSVMQSSRLTEAKKDLNSASSLQYKNMDKQKLSTNEDQNTISEILFDLGNLLSTFESNISKQEAIECLRRSMDIKILLLGADHSDCDIIKKKLNEITSHLSKQNNINKNNIANRSSSSINKSETITISPRKRLDKFLANLNCNYNKQSLTLSTNSNSLDNWIKRNSVIEMIPNKSERINSKYKNDSEFIHSSTVYSKQNSSGLKRSKSCHKENCKLPTSSSIDVHNIRTIHGPHSDLKNLMVNKITPKTNQLKISKHVYYKTTWYDLPPGSSKSRFKKFIKLTPNA